MKYILRRRKLSLYNESAIHLANAVNVIVGDKRERVSNFNSYGKRKVATAD